MKKIEKIIIILIITVLFVMPFAGCGENAVADITVWSTYSTAKVLRDTAYNKNYYRLAPQLDVSMAKGDTEGGQLIITAHNDVKEYYITVDDLKSEDGKIFPKESISVYRQHYLEIYEKSHNVQNNENFPVESYVPDALIPFDSAVEASENHIDSGNNQGITFEFKTTSAMAAGVYSGSFTLEANGKKYNIPVSVNVWNYDITRSSGKFMWDIYNHLIAQGELDDSDSMYEKYYNAMLEYRICAYHLPNSSDSAEAMLTSLLKYWGNPSFTGFFFPDFAGNKEQASEYNYVIAERALKDKINYFTAANYYHQSIDEPQTAEKAEEAVEIINKTKEGIQSAITRLESEGKFNGVDTAFAEELKSSMLNAPQVVTTYYEKYESLQGVVNAFCPTIDEYDSLKQQEENNQNIIDTNGEEWTYTCLNPYYPYPSYHIDDYSIGSRIMSFMMKSYGITAYLNWNAAMYTQVTYKDTDFKTTIDPYSDPVRMEDTATYFGNGDGYLFYPGKKYGIDGPVPSIRAVSARDAVEDYTTLNLLENIYSESASFYGLSAGDISVSNLLKEIYSELFSGTHNYNSDDRVFESARENIAEYLVAANGEGKLLIRNNETSENYARFELYADADKVLVDGKEITGSAAGNGKRYVCMKKLIGKQSSAQIEIIKNGKSTYVTHILKSASTSVNLSKVTKSDVNVSKYSEFNNDGDDLLFKINSNGDTPLEILSFTPYLSVNTGVNFDSVDKLSFTLTNRSDMDYDVKIGIGYGQISRKINEITIKAHSSVTVELNKIYLTDWTNLSKSNELFLSFDNIDENDKLYSERELVLSGLNYTEVEE